MESCSLWIDLGSYKGIVRSDLYRSSRERKQVPDIQAESAVGVYVEQRNDASVRARFPFDTSAREEESTLTARVEEELRQSNLVVDDKAALEVEQSSRSCFRNDSSSRKCGFREGWQIGGELRSYRFSG